MLLPLLTTGQLLHPPTPSSNTTSSGQPVLTPLGGSIGPPFFAHSYCVELKHFWLCAGLPQRLSPTKTESYLKTGLLSGSRGTLRCSLHICHIQFPLWPLLLTWAISCCFSLFDFSELSRLNENSDPFHVLPFLRLQMMSLTSVMWVIIYLKTTPVLQTTFLGKVCILWASRWFYLHAKLQCWWFNEQSFWPHS